MSKQPVQYFCDECGGLTACWCSPPMPLPLFVPLELEPFAPAVFTQKHPVNVALEDMRVAILSGDTGTALDAWRVLNALVRIHV